MQHANADPDRRLAVAGRPSPIASSPAPAGGCAVGNEGDVPAIAVFARAPVAGNCKTRLISLLGPVGAARLHRRLTLHALAMTRRAGLGQVVLYAAPDARHRFFRAVCEHCAVALCSQSGGNLGARMAAAFAAHAGPLLLVGSDCPALQAEHLIAAAAALAALPSTPGGANAAVFIPAEDGGYVLVGLRFAEPRLFVDIDWGSARVMAQTRRRLRDLALPWTELPVLWDVDRPADLLRLGELPAFSDCRELRVAGLPSAARARAGAPESP